MVVKEWWFIVLCVLEFGGVFFGFFYVLVHMPKIIEDFGNQGTSYQIEAMRLVSLVFIAILFLSIPVSWPLIAYDGYDRYMKGKPSDNPLEKC
jgi:hypothetical protein